MVIIEKSSSKIAKILDEIQEFVFDNHGAKLSRSISIGHYDVYSLCGYDSGNSIAIVGDAMFQYAKAVIETYRTYEERNVAIERFKISQEKQSARIKEQRDLRKALILGKSMPHELDQTIYDI